MHPEQTSSIPSRRVLASGRRAFSITMLAPADHAAWTGLGQFVLNLDEALSKE
ncbi:MAG: hypothetical protein HC841_02660 [Verrucomicrobiae bacterium]|nr:hypothetical protein [Verrucomicrobiae bacterium]